MNFQERNGEVYILTINRYRNEMWVRTFKNVYLGDTRSSETQKIIGINKIMEITQTVNKTTRNGGRHNNPLMETRK